MNKIFNKLLFLIIIFVSTTSLVNAMDEKLETFETAEPNQEASSNIEVSPSKIIMQVNDYGKTYTIDIANNTGADVSFEISEGIITQNSDGVTVPLNEDIEKSFLEILTPQLNILNSESGEIKVRTRIIGNDSTKKFPALVIRSVETKSADVGVDFEMYIPFIAQNTSGILSMNTETKINTDGFTFDPKLIVTGSVLNDGEKFFNPSGTIVILKNGIKVFEKELTSQISGLLMPEKAKGFSIEWDNNNENILESLGEYTVETRITNDLSDKIYGSRINYFYIPLTLVYITGGAIITIILIIIIIKIIKNKRKYGKQ